MSVTLHVGTRRGLFLARSDDRADWRIEGPLLEGREVYYAFRDYHTPGRVWAATDHKVWGSHVHRSDDGGRSWTVLDAAPHHADDRGLSTIWYLAPGPADEPDTLWAGIEPAGLFVSRDAGGSWVPSPLNAHPTRESWQPAGGGLALGNIQHDPSDPRRIYCSLSAGGVYRSDDGGGSWTPANRGTRATFQPREYPEAGQCVHGLRLHPAMPHRLYQQNHCGVYRSDDRGESWIEITDGLPSDFGYALALDPGDPDTAFVIPEESSHMRATVDGKLRVYRTTDAGASWTALTEGLPQEHAYVSVLRDAMDHDALDPVGLYFGTSTGHLFGSRDRGETWRGIAGFLPKILCVTAAIDA
ncbi:MAG: WD40/YVTN/BNR-like repeat-containing protein [Gemmatimonadota bacterium]